MSTETFEVAVTARTDTGKGASRRLRREGLVPGIVYGGKGDAAAIAVDQNELLMHLDHEAFYSHILTLKLGRRKEQVILKDLQRHPYKPTVSHVDFQRVVADEAIRVHVPLHFAGEDVAPGHKEGGVISHQITEVEVECLPGHLPEFIEVDISGMEMGDALHLSDLVVPEEVTLVTLAHDPENDQPVVSIHQPRVEPVGEEEAEEEAAEAAEGAEMAEAEGAEDEGEASDESAGDSSGDESQ
ncbi:MAG TPA: 50S ribosomal protein L25/general stress protein Ctc [Gammaproteobacteria bacterium]|nr:50S ribosomal protein L25/general stress protein Ctc [Gammaproteobacteria bacterium]